MSDATAPNTLAEVLASLQDQLSLVDFLHKAPHTQRPGERCLGERVYRRIGQITLNIYSESSTHRRPHFHIRYKQQYNASYDLRTFKRLAGVMPARYEQPIIDWARSNTSALEEAWRDLNSGDARTESIQGEGL